MKKYILILGLFVTSLAFSQGGYTKPLIHLEFNDTDKTVWNNGKGDSSLNTSFGESVLKSNTTGTFNTGFGATTFFLNTIGSSNTGFGHGALYNNTEGNLNTGFGRNSIFYNILGLNNTAIGYHSGSFINAGSSNTGPENSVFLGAETKALGATDTNQIVIGYQAEGNGTNTVVLGNDDITDTYLKGVLSIGITTDYVDNAAALSGGLVVGQVYRTGDILKIVH